MWNPLVAIFFWNGLGIEIDPAGYSCQFPDDVSPQPTFPLRAILILVQLFPLNPIQLHQSPRKDHFVGTLDRGQGRPE